MMATILVVDDDPSLREVLQAFLGEEGYTILLAESGEEALRLCRTHEGDIHVMITDLSMPGMDGIVLAKAVKEFRPHMSVMFSSAGLNQDNIDILPYGTVFIEKPFTLVTMEKALLKILASRQQ